MERTNIYLIDCVTKVFLAWKSKKSFFFRYHRHGKKVIYYLHNSWRIKLNTWAYKQMMRGYALQFSGLNFICSKEGSMRY